MMIRLVQNDNTGLCDKFIFFEEKDLTQVHNEVIKINIEVKINLSMLHNFVKVMIGNEEFRKLTVVNPNPNPNPANGNFWSIHGECKDLTEFKKLENVEEKFYDGKYSLHQIGFDLNSKKCRLRSELLGNIEIKYAHQNCNFVTGKGKMIVLNLHIYHNYSFNDIVVLKNTFINELLNFKNFIEMNKERIIHLEEMNILNFTEAGHDYKVAQESQRFYDKLYPFCRLEDNLSSKIKLLDDQIEEQEQAVKNINVIKDNLILFFNKAKINDNQQTNTKNITLEVTQDDLDDLGKNVPECKLQ